METSTHIKVVSNKAMLMAYLCNRKMTNWAGNTFHGFNQFQFYF